MKRRKPEFLSRAINNGFQEQSTMVIAKDIQNFIKLKEIITKHVGFQCAHYSDSFIARRVSTRLYTTHIDNYGDYGKLLEDNPEERELLNKELTINVTNFFRDATMWQVFRDQIIPIVANLKKKKGQKSIRVWSAGCSSGEEAISIAISFFEALGESFCGFRVAIVCTDINPSVIELAKQGLYEEQRFFETEPLYKERYFEKVDHEIYKAKNEVMDLIQFNVGDILTDPKPANIDIIFCRNTVIYFSLVAKSKLYEEFYSCLNSDGFFIMGKTEVLQGPARDKFQIFDPRERVYVKE
ncbi:protein-glutamate O-methyltransferase CheR [Candidatus Woesearchaeota archaeon]|nr:protein-glutamate O-methyltransferase CheR [Candidatus Woesearchaeota archaeon]